MEQISKQIDSSKIVSNITVCPIHKYPYIYIHSIPDKDQILKCAKCIIKQKISYNQIIHIDEVKQCGDDTIFDNWPFLQEDNDKITEIFNSFIDDKKISQFFKGFRSEIIDQIDKIEEKYIAQHKKLQENKKILIEYYNQVSLKKLLQESVTNLEKDFDNSIKELEKILKNDIQQIRKDEKSNIFHIHKQIMYYNDYLSIENMNTFKLEIKYSLNLMNDIVNYEIVDILKQEECSSAFQVKQNPNYIYQDVFLSSKQFLYSTEDLSIYKNQYIHKFINDYDYYLQQYHDQNREISKQSLKC